MALDSAIKLPESIITTSDLAKVRSELDRLAETVLQARLRQPDRPPAVPRPSKRLDDLATMAAVDMSNQNQLDSLRKALEDLQRSAPRVKISFATDASDEFLTKITSWFRDNIHGQVLLVVGLQPSMAAGFILRTPSKYFDCSLRKSFAQNKGMLSQALYATPPAAGASQEAR